jgi:hypothetical protein
MLHPLSGPSFGEEPEVRVSENRLPLFRTMGYFTDLTRPEEPSIITCTMRPSFCKAMIT